MRIHEHSGEATGGAGGARAPLPPAAPSSPTGAPQVLLLASPLHEHTPNSEQYLRYDAVQYSTASVLSLP
jgi:hypothetical protein